MTSKIRKSCWLQDITWREYTIGFTKSTVFFVAVLYLFYESALPGIVLFPIWFFYFREWMEESARKKELEFRSQFRDSIQTLASALKAGYSSENAILETKNDLLPMYGPDYRISKEYSLMVHQIGLHIPVGQVLSEFAARVRQEDVENFVNVFVSAKRSGGDSIAIIRNAIKIISDKIDTEKEIQTMLAAKKLEFEIMSFIPFGIILYMKLTFGDFFQVLYGNLAGIAVMTAALIIYLFAYMLGKKLTRIEI